VSPAPLHHREHIKNLKRCAQMWQQFWREEGWVCCPAGNPMGSCVATPAFGTCPTFTVETDSELCYKELPCRASRPSQALHQALSSLRTCCYTCADHLSGLLIHFILTSRLTHATNALAFCTRTQLRTADAVLTAVRDSGRPVPQREDSDGLRPPLPGVLVSGTSEPDQTQLAHSEGP
jgi:hypothetical protein